MKMIKRLLFSIFVIFYCLTLTAQELNKNDNDGVPRPESLLKRTARVDEAIGVMNKGQLCNLTMNYGQISDTRLEDPGNRPTDEFFNFRYPKTKPYGSMVDDFALCFAVEKNSKNGNNGNFIDGYTANGNEDWIAKDGSLGKTHYDGSGDEPMLLYVDGTTPYLAHSDLPQTWPIDKSGNHFWPGYFRRDPTIGKVYDGEFVSDRDVYAVFTDGNNRQGDVIGIEIEMMAYCYGRVYAEDFQFYELFIHNTSGDTIKQAWIGIYQDPDCSDYGEEILINPAGHTFSDPYPVIMQRDFSGEIGGASSPNSLGRLEDMNFGTIILETPKNIGVTDFHYFIDPGPTYDEELWPIISSRKTDPDIAAIAAEYFHGANPRLDDVSQIAVGQDLVFMVASGPFDLAPDDVLKYTIGVVVGDTDADFMKNIEMAVQMFEKGFVGPSAPPGPRLSAVAGDEKVTLYWDNSSEFKPDPLSGELDFEGYKIYRSEDSGVTWGKPITDAHGNVIGYVPIAQFDKKNEVMGLDPVNPANYLGDNNGLQYVFVDPDVVNGIAYSYTVTAYDHGNPAGDIPSFETAKGVGTAEKHFATVTPRPEPLAFSPSQMSAITQVSGKGRGEIIVDVIDPIKYEQFKLVNNHLSNPIFKMTFEGFPAARLSLYDSSANNKILKQAMNFETDLLPVINDVGIKLTIQSVKKIGGIETITDETGKDVFGMGKSDQTSSWYVTAKEVSNSSVDVRSNDYEIRFTAEGSIAYSLSKNPVALMPVPFEVWRIYPDTQKVMCEYNDRNKNLLFEEKEFIYIGNEPYPDKPPAIGDSLRVDFPTHFPIQISFEKVLPGTNNPQGGKLPAEGQKATFKSYCAFSDGSGFASASEFRKGDVFVFSLKEATVDSKREHEFLDEVRVVPNPYVVTSLFDPKQNVHSLKFMYLPASCDITIYSLSGVKIKEIHHNNGTGIENWNLTNDFGQDISFGVYVYVITTSEGKNKVGKLAIVK